MAQWYEPNISSAHLIGLYAKGLLPSPEGCRIPDDPCFPKLRPNEVVSFASFHEQGLALSAHDFLHDLLYCYQIKLHHIL
jgi:hypothetical protein